MVKIASWNVNSINSRIDHLIKYLSGKDAPDVLALQELKCEEHSFPKSVLDNLGYNYVVSGQKTYNGVAIISRYPIDESIKILNYPEIDNSQARYIEAVISLNNEAIRIVNVYVPNGQSIDSDKFTYKKIFFDALYLKAKELLKFKEKLFIVGDFNVAPEAIDVFDPLSLESTICFHYEERKRFNSIIGLGFFDAYRVMHPNNRQFTWWDYRAGAWQQNKGLRIDHILLSPEAADAIKNCDVELSLRKLDKPSDHAPIWCVI